MSGTSSLALPPGTRIESFEIRDVLGAGGFGITYKAWDHQLQCDVAIKEYLPSDLATRSSDHVTVTILDQTEDRTEGFASGLEKFLEEARILARFKDPNLVSVKQFISVNGTAYMVMDYEKGLSLAQRMRDDPPPVPNEFLNRLATRLLRALATVHEHRILHRDIKPGNIYLREDGDPVLIDFGSARERLHGRRAQELTSMVTLGYAPHEQYHRRGNQGPWTDLYALAATLYFCATGSKPADGMERYLAIQDGNADPLLPCSRIAAGLYDANLLAAIDWMLQVAVERRPPNAAAVLDVVEGRVSAPATAEVARPGTDEEATVLLERTEVIREPARGPATPVPARRLKLLAAAGAAAVLVVALFTTVYVSGRVASGASAAFAALASGALGTDVTVDSARYSLLDNELQLDGVKVANPGGYPEGAVFETRLTLSPGSRWWWRDANPVFERVTIGQVTAHLALSADRQSANVRDFLKSLPTATYGEPRVLVHDLELGPVAVQIPPDATGESGETVMLDAPSLPVPVPDSPASATGLVERVARAVAGAADDALNARHLLATKAPPAATATRADAGPRSTAATPQQPQAAPGKAVDTVEQKGRSVLDWIKRKLDEPPNRKVLPND